jgi:hypothetical protein
MRKRGGIMMMIIAQSFFNFLIYIWHDLDNLYMDSIWTLYGLYMDSIWTLYGLYMDSIWTLYGLYMDSICTL